MGNPDKLARIRSRAEKQLSNSAHWWLWEQETRRTNIKARVASKVEGTWLIVRTYYRKR